MNIQDFMFWLSIYVYFEAQGSNTFSFARSNPKRFPVSGGWIITMSGIPLTDEGVTSDGGAAGETISLPPKTSKLPTPRKCKMSTWKEMQWRLYSIASMYAEQAQFMYFCSYSGWVGFYQSYSENWLFTHNPVFRICWTFFCIRCCCYVTERAKACPSQQYLFLYTQTMETGVNL